MPISLRDDVPLRWPSREDDPDSELYAVSRDADTVIRYMAANTPKTTVAGCYAG